MLFVFHLIFCSSKALRFCGSTLLGFLDIDFQAVNGEHRTDAFWTAVSLGSRPGVYFQRLLVCTPPKTCFDPRLDMKGCMPPGYKPAVISIKKERSFIN